MTRHFGPVFSVIALHPLRELHEAIYDNMGDGGDDGSQRHRARAPDGFEFPALTLREACNSFRLAKNAWRFATPLLAAVNAMRHDRAN
jgi:hypothetical protein